MPDWDKIPRNEYLYPAYIYWFGFGDSVPSYFDPKVEDSFIPTFEEIKEKVEEVFDELDIS